MEALDGWDIAVNLTRPGRRIGDPGLRLHAERLAAQAVLARARGLVGPLRLTTQVVREQMLEPHAGELDLDATLENLVGKAFPEPEDWIVQRREERHHQVVMMVDTSLSMSGENMAMAAVAAAVLALKLRAEDLCVVVFDDVAEAVTHLGERDAAEEVVRRMLSQPVGGYTNIEAALELGAAELEARAPAAAACSSPTAWPPRRRPAARGASLPRLFVMLMEDYKMNPELCRGMADAGHGDVFPVGSFQAASGAHADAPTASSLRREEGAVRPAHRAARQRAGRRRLSSSF